MAITPASFIPEQRDAGGNSAAHGGGAGPGPSVGHAASVHGGMDTSYNEATDSAHVASHESTPVAHPITGTPLPKSTGAGKGNIHRGGRGGK